MCIPFLYFIPYVLVFSRAAVTIYQKLDGLKQQFWRPDIEIEVSAGLPSLQRLLSEVPSHLSGSQESLAFPGL